MTRVAKLSRSNATSRWRAQGFTLIEVMVAVTILAFITTILFGAFSQTATTKAAITAAQERTHTARAALMRMARELEMAFLSDSENTALQERRTMFVAAPHNDVDELRFSAFGHQRLHADAAEADTAVISYYGDRDPENRSILNLMRRETRRLQALDPKTIPGEGYVLCPNVSRLKFSFYDYKKKEWKEDWSTIGADGVQYLPSAVRVTLTVIDERGIEVPYATTARIQMTEYVSYKPVAQ